MKRVNEDGFGERDQLLKTTRRSKRVKCGCMIGVSTSQLHDNTKSSVHSHTTGIVESASCAITPSVLRILTLHGLEHAASIFDHLFVHARLQR